MAKRIFPVSSFSLSLFLARNRRLARAKLRRANNIPLSNPSDIPSQDRVLPLRDLSDLTMAKRVFPVSSFSLSIFLARNRRLARAKLRRAKLRRANNIPLSNPSDIPSQLISEISLGNLPDVPSPLIHEILSQLPVKFLIKFVSVSKEWRAMIQDQEMIEKQRERALEANDGILIFSVSNRMYAKFFYSIDFPHTLDELPEAKLVFQPLFHPPKMANTGILNSCHGLLCIDNGFEEEVAIWNPMIRRYKTLPFEPVSTDGDSTALGFGYDVENLDYKVVRISGIDINVYETKVYSLKEHCWKSVEGNLPETRRGYFSDNPVCLNGVVYWLMECNKFDEDKRNQGLLSFDLATEKFRVYDVPVAVVNIFSMVICVLEGRLCLTAIGNEGSELWMMELDGEACSWTKIFTIEEAITGYRPLGFSKNGKHLLLQIDSVLGWYDLEERRVRYCFIKGIPDRCYPLPMVTCVGTLSLLNGDPVINTYGDSVPRF